MKREAPLIAHVIYRLDFGGLENGLVNVINRMPPERYRHAIVCLAGVGAQFRKRLQRTSIEVVSLDKRPGKDIAVYARMWRTLRRLRPDIVHTRNLGTIDMQWVAAACGVRRRVHGEHGWEATDPRGTNRRNLRIRKACRPVIHRYVPMSRDIACWLERDVNVASARICQIYSGVDAERFRPGPRLNCEPRSSVGDAVFSIGTVGRLDPVKNQSALLYALSAIRKQQPGLAAKVRLVVIGDGPLRTQLQSLASDLDVVSQVTFTGARSDTPEWMREFDVFALPSLNEGISNTILEAMATGLPVVAANVGGNPELVVPNVTGSLYDPDHPEGLVHAILRYANEPGLRESHGAAGRHRVLTNFSLDSMVEGYGNLYDDLMNAEP